MDMQNLKSDILVLFANSYEMKDESGRLVSGCTVHYLFWGDKGSNLFCRSESNISKPVGLQRAKCSVDFGLRQNIMVAPAIYEGTFEMSVGSDGKPVTKLVDLHYKCNVEMKERIVPGLHVPNMIIAEPDTDKKGDK